METAKLDEKREELQGDREEKWVYDSSVDHKGRTPLRASTGVWKANLFILAIEFGERLSYFGLATNLIIYLTRVLHQDVKTAAKNVNYWSGFTTMMPLIGGFIADAYLGRFSAVLISSLIYLLGTSLLTMSQLVPSLKPCSKDTCHIPWLHEVIFFTAMYLISVATGGHKPSLESFGADQFDDEHPEERKQKLSYFNWWNCGLCSGAVLGVTVIVYIQDNVSWAAADIVLSSTMAISLLIFVLGKPFYRYRAVEGSPLTPMIRVLVAAVAKRHLSYPSDARDLYEVPRSQNGEKRLLLCHTKNLRLLDKAAVIEHKDDEKRSPWRLATVTQVEEVKMVVSMIPIWITSLPFGICVAQGSTFFIKQGSLMNRRVVGSFEIPPTAIFALGAIGMIISLTFYDKLLVPVLRRTTGNERGMSVLQRMGTGMVFSVVAMATAAMVETKRLRVAEEVNTNVVSMSVFWLVPQFLILGLGDGFTLVGLQEYFYDQVPETMRSLGIAFYLSVIGASNFLSGFLITVVDQLSERGGKASWFAKDLNRSRLDYFYWLLAALNGVNLCVFVLLATRFSYKRVQRGADIADCSEDADVVASRVPV